MNNSESTEKTEVSLRLRFPSKEAFDKIREAVRVSKAKSMNAFIVAVASDAADTVLKGSNPTPGQLAGENITRS